MDKACVNFPWTFHIFIPTLASEKIYRLDSKNALSSRPSKMYAYDISVRNSIIQTSLFHGAISQIIENLLTRYQSLKSFMLYSRGKKILEKLSRTRFFARFENHALSFLLRSSVKNGGNFKSRKKSCSWKLF